MSPKGQGMNRITWSYLNSSGSFEINFMSSTKLPEHYSLWEKKQEYSKKVSSTTVSQKYEVWRKIIKTVTYTWSHYIEMHQYTSIHLKYDAMDFNCFFCIISSANRKGCQSMEYKSFSIVNHIFESLVRKKLSENDILRQASNWLLSWTFLHAWHIFWKNPSHGKCWHNPHITSESMSWPLCPAERHDKTKLSYLVTKSRRRCKFSSIWEMNSDPWLNRSSRERALDRCRRLCFQVHYNITPSTVPCSTQT